MATARVIPVAATSASSCLLARTPFSLKRTAVNAGGLCFLRRAGAGAGAAPSSSSSSRRLFACSAIHNPQVLVKEEGKPETLDYRVFLVDGSGKKVSPWHDIPLQLGNGVFNFVVEIPKESSAKMEVATDEPRTDALAPAFSLEEASAHDLQLAFRQNKLTSRQLTEFYLNRIRRLNPLLRGVIEVNPDALRQADRADRERKAKPHGLLSALHGIPILLKDNIATKDEMNTTAGSFALLGSVVPRDAGVVARLRSAGAVLLGKASLSEWAHYRSSAAPSGWCARSGQGKNPYNLSANPCGSSSGSAISVAANMGAVSLGTDTDGSILCPSSCNSVVGIKPTLGLTSRGGVVPITPRQDTVGPMCRTVADAVDVLDVIVGFDPYDAKATREASKYIPRGGYKRFLKADGLKGKRLGIVRNNPYFGISSGTPVAKAFHSHFKTLRKQGAALVDHLELANINEIYSTASGEDVAMSAEFKLALNKYLRDLVVSPVRSLADVIAFNNNHKHVEKIDEYGQDLLLAAQVTGGIDATVKSAQQNVERLSQGGFEKLMRQNKLDALVTPGYMVSTVLAIGGCPGISVPAGYNKDGVPFGICFAGLRGSEPTLIEIAYGFEQATKIRRPPSFTR